jgi:polysaccharide pyruvyl transferase WcaK-like protein
LGVELETIIPKTLAEVRSVVAGANLVIGARMHACLNALSCGTPAIAWAYSRKFTPLMSDLGWDFVIELGDPTRNPAAETMRFIDAVSQSEFEGKVSRVRDRAQQLLSTAVTAMSRVR